MARRRGVRLDAGASVSLLKPRTAWVDLRAASPWILDTGPRLACTDQFRTMNRMSAVAEPQRDARLDLRLPQETRVLISEAAALSGSSLTDYILNLVVPAARRDVLESRTIRLSRDAWDDFLDILDRPDNERLATLREHRPDWDATRR